MARRHAGPEIPDFDAFLKVRQNEVVERKKEKKRGALPWWPNLAATKGLGVGAKAAALVASKAGFLIMTMALAAGAGVFGLAQRGRLQAEADAMKKKQFEASLLREHILKQNAAPKNAMPTVDRARGDTFGFVSAGGLSGPQAGEGAAGAAGADASAGAADGKAGAEAGGAKEQEGAQNADPNAMAAELMAQAGARNAAGAAAGGRNADFGKLSQGMGGGMRGGGGLAGGVGRGFDQMSMKNAMLARAESFKGGNPAGIMDNKLRKGNARKWEARGGKTAQARASASANRLRQMAGTMAANRTGDVAKAATANTAAWEQTAAPGQITTGAGASIPGASGPGNAGVGAFPGDNEGGPMNMGPGDVGGDLASNVPNVPEYRNATPYQWAVDLAKLLMIAIMVLSLIIMAMKATVIGNAYIPMLTNIVAGMGAILGILGVYMMAMSQYAQGMLWTVIGGAVTLLALAAPTAVSEGSKGIAIGWQGFVLPLLGGAGWAAGGAAHDSDVEGFRNTEKDNYRKEYGVDPDTKEVLNREKFDGRHGEGAADRWDEQRKFDDMR